EPTRHLCLNCPTSRSLRKGLRLQKSARRALCAGAPIPMRKLPTGEPCAGEPPARFGGRGGREPFPTPIILCSTYSLPKYALYKRRVAKGFKNNEPVKG